MEPDRVAQLQQALDELRITEQKLEEASSGQRRGLSTAVRQMTKTVGALQKTAIKSYPSAYIACRDLGHVWSPAARRIEGGILYRSLSCGRCSMERDEGVSKFGELLWRRYRRPAGYGLSTLGGQLKFPKEFWRGLEFMMQATRTHGSKVAESE